MWGHDSHVDRIYKGFIQTFNIFNWNFSWNFPNFPQRRSIWQTFSTDVKAIAVTKTWGHKKSSIHVNNLSIKRVSNYSFQSPKCEDTTPMWTEYTKVLYRLSTYLIEIFPEISPIFLSVGVYDKLFQQTLKLLQSPKREDTSRACIYKEWVEISSL